MKTESLTKAGNLNNEDSCYVCKDFGFVIDGATGVFDKNITDMPTDAQWFSNSIKDFLIKNLLNLTKTLKEIMLDAVNYATKEFFKFKNADITFMPSASIVIFRINGKFVEYFVLGDCSLIFLTKSNLKCITQKRVSQLDSKNLKKLKKYAKQYGVDVVNARKYIQTDLQAQRSLKNTKKGYWILSDNTEALNHAEIGKLEKEKIKQIVGVSDGFSQIYDLFKFYSKKQFLKELSINGIEKTYQTLFLLQQTDNLCNNYPRFKLRDDATVINVEF